MTSGSYGSTDFINTIPLADIKPLKQDGAVDLPAPYQAGPFHHGQNGFHPGIVGQIGGYAAPFHDRALILRDASTSSTLFPSKIFNA